MNIRRQIDCAVAETIFGWRWVTLAGYGIMMPPFVFQYYVLEHPALGFTDGRPDGREGDPECRQLRDFTDRCQVPAFSADIARAWEIVGWARLRLSRWQRFQRALQEGVSGEIAPALVDAAWVWRLVTPQHICLAALVAAHYAHEERTEIPA